MSEGGSGRLTSGWAIVGWAALAAVGGSAMILTTYGTDAEGTGVALRYTARTSFLCYMAAFAAAPLAAVMKTSFTRWLRANRRYFGVGFAASHTVHLAAILHLAYLKPGIYDATTLILGGLGYVFLAAMAATSFNSTTRMLGPKAWKALHKTGMYYLGFIFVATVMDRVGAKPPYAIFPLAYLGVWALRVWVFASRRRSAGARAAAA